MWLLFQDMVSLRASSPFGVVARSHVRVARSHVFSLIASLTVNGELGRGQRYGLIDGRVFYKRTGLMICNQGLNLWFSGSFGNWQKSLYQKKKYLESS